MSRGGGGAGVMRKMLDSQLENQYYITEVTTDSSLPWFNPCPACNMLAPELLYLYYTLQKYFFYQIHLPRIGTAWLWSTSTGSKESTCLGEHSHVCLCCFFKIVMWITIVNTIQLLMFCGLTKSLSWTVLSFTVLADIHLPRNWVYTFHMSD